MSVSPSTPALYRSGRTIASSGLRWPWFETPPAAARHHEGFSSDLVLRSAQRARLEGRETDSAPSGGPPHHTHVQAARSKPSQPVALGRLSRRHPWLRRRPCPRLRRGEWRHGPTSPFGRDRGPRSGRVWANGFGISPQCRVPQQPLEPKGPPRLRRSKDLRGATPGYAPGSAEASGATMHSHPFGFTSPSSPEGEGYELRARLVSRCRHLDGAWRFLSWPNAPVSPRPSSIEG